MTGAPVSASRRVRRAAPSAAAEAPLAVRLGAFAALCAYGVGHWGGLVVDPPAGRLAAVAVVAIAGAALIAAAARLPGPLAIRRLGAAAAALATLAAGLLAAGLDARLIAPPQWPELSDRLDQGLAGLRTADWPYTGDDPWSRLAVLLGAPAFASLAAALAFWPAGRGALAARVGALTALLVLYAVPATELELGGELLRGAVLAVLVAAWLWPPRLGRRDARVAAAVIGAAALLAVPAAAALDRDEPWLDYRGWNWFGTADGTAFDWSHQYGPVTWSREGTTLLVAKADRPLYWKLETLDRFDGFRWVRSAVGASGGPQMPAEENRKWLERVTFTVRNLRTERIPVTGMPLQVSDAGSHRISADGTTFALDGPLREGDSYSVRAYVPNPDAEQLRAAVDWEEEVRRYVTVGLPRPGETNLDRVRGAGDPARPPARPPRIVSPSFWGSQGGGTPGHERLLRESPYAQTYALARRLTAGAPTAYDAVKRIERHLRGNYAYSERPPSQEYPLEAFMFEDLVGYCQQFSGAMALMLRMVGIPARVVGGFAPGSYDRDAREFRIRDLDAHSWVEVLFPGIGWVQFDPTPSAAPAESRSRPGASPSAATGDTGERGDSEPTPERQSEPAGAAAAGPSDRRLPPWALPALALAALALAPLVFVTRRRLARGRGGPDAEAALRELEMALRRLGYPLKPRTTLLELERRLRRRAGPVSAAYVRSLRERRYADGGRAAGRGPRRHALRRELSRLGSAGTLRGLIALPPFRRP